MKIEKRERDRDSIGIYHGDNATLAFGARKRRRIERGGTELVTWEVGGDAAAGEGSDEVGGERGFGREGV